MARDRHDTIPNSASASERLPSQVVRAIEWEPSGRGFDGRVRPEAARPERGVEAEGLPRAGLEERSIAAEALSYSSVGY